MATKDWKKTSYIEDWRTIYTNKKTGKRLALIWNEGFTSWRVYNYSDINKTFSKGTVSQNKAAAKIFAKKYMVRN